MSRARKLEPFENEICARYLAGEDSYSLAECFNVSPPTIIKALKANGVGIRTQKERPDLQRNFDLDKALELLQKGLTLREIAAKVGTTNGTLSKAFRAKGGVAKRASIKRQSLTPERRAEVVARYKAGENYAELGTYFDVSHDPISSALHEAGIHPRTGWSKYRTIRWTDRKSRVHIFKSSWELAYAKHLDSNGLDWEYEIQHYPLKTCRRYTPDFFVYKDGVLSGLIEVHGWMDSRTESKLLEFVSTYSTLSLELLGPRELVELGLLDKKWETHPQGEKVSKLRLRLIEIRSNLTHHVENS